MPGKACAIASCKNNSSKALGYIFHNFPKDDKVRQDWIRLCNRSERWNPRTSSICSVHFTEEDYKRDLRNELLGLPVKKFLKPNVVPSLFLGIEPISVGACSSQRKANEDDIPNELLPEENELLPKENELLPEENEVIAAGSSENIEPLNETYYQRKYETLLASHNKLQLKFRAHKQKCKRRVNSLQTHLNYYKKKVQYKEDNKAEKVLSKFFSKNQINLLLQKRKKVNWTQPELSMAVTMRYYSKKSYLYLRNVLKFPLPGLSSLRQWACKINMKKGVLEDVLKFMELAGEDMSEIEKCLVIQFDEVKVKSVLGYDKSEDQLIGPHNQMQVIMVRGLFAKWKQPVYISFDTKMTQSIIFDIIYRLHQINYKVVATVSDCGGGNMGLLKEMGVDIEKTYFHHPQTNEKINMFADAPHLLELLRNWLIDTGFILEDQTIINHKPLLDLIEMTDKELNVCFKLTEKHIKCEKTKRQNVRLAAELLSHSTATALHHYQPGSDKKLAKDVGNFIDLVNTWFDISNSYIPFNKNPHKSAYGIHLEEQNKVLDEMLNTILTMRATGKRSLQIFQKGIIISIKSLRQLFSDLKKAYGISSICTNKLNQDSLENFFFQLRSRGGLDDHPSPLNALYRIRMVILGKNPGILDSAVNTEDRMQEEYLIANVMKKVGFNVNSELDKDGIPIEEYENKENVEIQFTRSSSGSSEASNSVNDYSQEMTNDSLEYIAGYLAKKFKKKYPFLGIHTHKSSKEHDYQLPSWVSHLSYGGLIKPTEEWLSLVEKFNKTFLKYHGEDPLGFNKEKNVVKNVTEKIQNKLKQKIVHSDIIEVFVRLRTIIRMNYFNQKIEESKTKSQNLKRKNSDNDSVSRKSTKKNEKNYKLNF